MKWINKLLDYFDLTAAIQTSFEVIEKCKHFHYLWFGRSFSSIRVTCACSFHCFQHVLFAWFCIGSYKLTNVWYINSIQSIPFTRIFAQSNSDFAGFLKVCIIEYTHQQYTIINVLIRIMMTKRKMHTLTSSLLICLTIGFTYEQTYFANTNEENLQWNHTNPSARLMSTRKRKTGRYYW